MRKPCWNLILPTHLYLFFTLIIYFSYSREFVSFIHLLHIPKVEIHRKKINIKKYIFTWMYLCYRTTIKQKQKIHSSHWQAQLHMPEMMSFTIQPSPNSISWELGLYVLILKPITKLDRRIEPIDRKCECVPPCHAHNLWMLVLPSLQPASVLTHMHMLLFHITKINK